MVGLGVFRTEAGREARNAATWALQAGYRHIDTAAVYRNEADVGAAVRESGVPRGDIFVTTKLWNGSHGYHKAKRAFDRSLERLGLDYVDLYLIHWPVEKLRLKSWRALEELHESGRARAIGVSNYMVRHLEELLASCRIPPAVNQIELHPFNARARSDTVEMCDEAGIVIEAYSPLTKAQRLDNPTLVEIGKRHGKSAAQVLVRYGVEKGWVTLPKSANRERIVANADVFDFRLDAGEMQRMDGLDEGLVTAWDPTEVP